MVFLESYACGRRNPVRADSSGYRLCRASAHWYEELGIGAQSRTVGSLSVIVAPLACARLG